MKKAIKILLTVSIVVDIVVAVYGLIFAFAGTALGDLIYSDLIIEMDQVEAELVAATFAGTITFVGAILLIGGVVGAIFAFISLNKIKTATTKIELKGSAIASIITGAFSSTTQIVAGILMLVIKNEQL